LILLPFDSVKNDVKNEIYKDSFNPSFTLRHSCHMNLKNWAKNSYILWCEVHFWWTNQMYRSALQSWWQPWNWISIERYLTAVVADGHKELFHMQKIGYESMHHWQMMIKQSTIVSN